MTFILIAVVAAESTSLKSLIGGRAWGYRCRSPASRRLEYGYGLLNQRLRAIHKHGPQPSGMFHIERTSLTSV